MHRVCSAIYYAKHNVREREKIPALEIQNTAIVVQSLHSEVEQRKYRKENYTTSLKLQ